MTDSKQLYKKVMSDEAVEQVSAIRKYMHSFVPIESAEEIKQKNRDQIYAWRGMQETVEAGLKERFLKAL